MDAQEGWKVCVKSATIIEDTVQQLLNTVATLQDTAIQSQATI
jgi:hypothetical protein